jgi:hypothetical protein
MAQAIAQQEDGTTPLTDEQPTKNTATEGRCEEAPQEKGSRSKEKLVMAVVTRVARDDESRQLVEKGSTALADLGGACEPCTFDSCVCHLR